MQDGCARPALLRSEIKRSICRLGKVVLRAQLFDVLRSKDLVFQSRGNGFGNRGGRIRAKEAAHAAADAAAWEAALVGLEVGNKLRGKLSGQTFVYKKGHPFLRGPTVMFFRRRHMLSQDVRFVAQRVGAAVMYSENLMAVLVENLDGVAGDAHGDGLPM